MLSLACGERVSNNENKMVPIVSRIIHFSCTYTIMKTLHSPAHHRTAAWKYFVTDGTKYKNDKNHLACWCELCLDDEVQKTELLEKDGQLLGDDCTSRSISEIEEDGKFHYVCLVKMGAENQ